jgi:TFIIF-interacting CTD phosphatase-like protein
MFLKTLFSEKGDFVREKKIDPRGKKYSESERSSKESNSTSNMGNHMSKRR